MPLNDGLNNISKDLSKTETLEKPSFEDFMKTMKRLLTNKLILFNMFSGVFCILSISPYMSFIAKYLEVQFQTSPGGGTIIVGRTIHCIPVEFFFFMQFIYYYHVS